MLKKMLLGLGAIALLTACSANKNKQSADVPQDGKHFGALVTAKNAITYDQLIPKMAQVDSMPAKVSGQEHFVKVWQPPAGAVHGPVFRVALEYEFLIGQPLLEPEWSVAHHVFRTRPRRMARVDRTIPRPGRRSDRRAASQPGRAARNPD